MTTTIGISSSATTSETTPKSLTPRERFATAKITLDYISRFDISTTAPAERRAHYLNMLTKCIALDTSTNEFIIRKRGKKGNVYVTKTKKELKDYLGVVIYEDERHRDVKLSSFIDTSEFIGRIAKYEGRRLISDDPNVFQMWEGIPTGEYHQEFVDELKAFLKANIVEDKARNLFLGTLKWLVKHNWKKHNLCFMLIGGDGEEGKTTLAKIIQTLVPNHSNTEFSMDKATGRFNSYLVKYLYMNIGEISSDSSGNHGVITVLKQLTNDEQLIEKKGEDMDGINDSDCFVFITACSNNYNCLGIFNDKAIHRRWVPVEYRSGYNDFEKLYEMIRHKDFGATFAQYLVSDPDIPAVNPHKRPPRMAVMDRIEQVSRNPIYDFAEELTRNEFTLCSKKSKYPDKYAIPAADFNKLYRDWCAEQGVSKPLDAKNYVSKLKEYMIDDRVSICGKQQRAYIWLKDLPEGDQEDVIVQDTANLDAE